MKSIVSVVRQLQADAIDPDVPVARLLRIAKLIATKLDQEEALRWINRELDGYMGLELEEVPPYRVLRGEPKGFNPYHGWQPIQFENPEHAKKFSMAPLGMSIGSIENDLRARDSHKGQFTFHTLRR